MKTKKLLTIVVLSAGMAAFAAPAKTKAPAVKRDANTVKSYIMREVGAQAIKDIGEKEGGKAFLEKFFKDQDWMEQFAGSGPVGGITSYGCHATPSMAKCLEVLDLLYWNDKGGWGDTKTGRNFLTSLALNHAHDFGDEKLVEIAECYREWDRNGSLHSSCKDMDVREWREVTNFGQNSELDVESLRWIHDFATVPGDKYYGLPWECSYRLQNCFGASVHGPDYYRPWYHRWSIQELRYRVGGVCGALSKFGSHGAESHGIRSYTAGQPGHCAYMLWNLKENRWDHAYSVTGHTMAHFVLSDEHRFAASEEQDRYYSNPRRMDAEFLRWKGEYKKSMQTCNNNWQAASEWMSTLKSKEEWDDFGATVRATFSDAPCLGWSLYRKYLKSMGGDKTRMLAAAKLGLAEMKECTAKTVEPIYLDETIMDPLAEIFGNDKAAMWGIFQAALDGYAGSPTFFRQTINWGSVHFMSSAEETKRYLLMVAASAKKHKCELDYAGMILSASKAGDITTFKQVYRLMDNLSKNAAPKPNGKSFPKQDYGGDLLSEDGLLQTSSTCGYDSPTRYRNALNAEDFADMSAFHTDKGKEAWAQVLLPGESEIMGVTVVDRASGYNATRQVPMEILVSSDGVAWEKVGGATEPKGEFKFNVGGKKAKYVRVARVKDAKEEVFHLHKILVYGKKLY